MRWDDLQLLHSIDEIEKRGAYIGNGLLLLEELARQQGLSYHEELPSFAIELALACDAGYLTWTDRSSLIFGRYSPTTNQYNWLQTIDDIKLTLAGRDRARGRVIQIELPDPDEDDNRMITGLTMEEIARSIGDMYTPAQLPRYLRESGIPAEAVPDVVTGDKWQYVLNVLESLHEGGSAARRALRKFVGGWLEGYFHVPPSADVRKRITSLLAQQGWYVRESRLVIGEYARMETGTVSPLRRDARLAALHTDIRQVTDRFVEAHLDVAIFEAFKAIVNRVKRMSGLDLDGSALMDKTLGAANPMIVFADLSTKSGKDIQQGLYFIGSSVFSGIYEFQFGLFIEFLRI